MLEIVRKILTISGYGIKNLQKKVIVIINENLFIVNSFK